MRRALFILVAGVALGGCTTAPGEDPVPVEYVGDLRAELVSSERGPGAVLEEPTDEERAALGGLVPTGATVRVARIEWRPDTTADVFLVEPENGERFVIADGDGSGTFAASERSTLQSVEGRGALLEAPVTLALEDGPTPTYELVVGWHDYSGTDIPTERLPPARLLANRPVVEGTVDVGGRQVRIQVPYSFETNGIGGGNQYVDANYDGEYDTWFTSRESAYVREGEPMPIYRVDDRYVSIREIDLADWKVRLADHPAEAYQRIELEIGNEMPDFGFVDLEGNTRRLAEFRGKYVLIDIWGTWCGPCREDVPHHREAYAAYRDRGFEILGLNDEQSKSDSFGEGLDKAREFIAEHDMTWPQATEESVKHLLVERLMVRAWPTAILLDPDGRIVSLDRPDDELRLRFDGLARTLETLLGAH